MQNEQDDENRDTPGSASGQAPGGLVPKGDEAVKQAKDHADRKRAELGLGPPDHGVYSDEAMEARKGKRKRRSK